MDWADNFKCWEADKEPHDANRFCGVCGANKPLENHELWCPNEPDRAHKDDSEFWTGLGTEANQFWYDTRADEDFDTDTDDECCDCDECLAADAVTDAEVVAWLEEEPLASGANSLEEWIAVQPAQPMEAYHAPERPYEDWGKRDECLNVHYTDMTSGAPTRATTLPTDAAGRKAHPVASGVLDYFGDALVAISHVSWKGNEQHNPGTPLHWDRSKSTDEADTMIRHFLQRGSLDVDGMSHTAKMAWRALALLQKEIEAGRG